MRRILTLSAIATVSVVWLMGHQTCEQHEHPPPPLGDVTGGDGPPPNGGPSVLLILTDDQRWDTVQYMPVVMNELAGKGVNFSNAYVSEPSCCPSRAITYSGRWAHNTGVAFNRDSEVAADAPIDPTTVTPPYHGVPNGGIVAFDWSTGIQHALDLDGYRTGLFGKVMNQNDEYAPTVPIGWDDYVTFTQDGFNFYGQASDWYNANPADYFYNDNGVIKTAATVRTETPVTDPHDEVSPGVPDDYSTDLTRDLALEFLDSLGPTEPFFLVWAPYAPHFDRGFYNLPPARRHDGDFSTFSSSYVTPANFNEPDISDKPEWLRLNYETCEAILVQGTCNSNTLCTWDTGAGACNASIWTSAAGIAANLDNFRNRTLESLQAVDEGVFALLAKLDSMGRGVDTMIIYTSDNGYAWGEHRMGQKLHPYEESVRVPMIVRYLTVRPASFPEVNPLLVSNVDIAPTIADLAGLSIDQYDGASWMPIVGATVGSWRTTLLIEGWAAESTVPSILVPGLFPVMPDYAIARQANWKLIDYATGTDELYDMVNDPLELVNEISNPAHAQTVTDLRAALTVLLAE